ncbi:MAG TPA: integrase arm-type DNA-binding domain-containing protein [Acetobacteraceae bacterium]|nr:integrase arm-type DNA-binding domain-containing protein [Acetobacteraceae bacterium]
MGRINSARLRTLTKPGMYGDGGGLYLRVRGPEHRSWLYRYKVGGRGHLLGLGSLADVSLAEAREAAAAARKLVRQGEDPIQNKRAEWARRAAEAGLHTFSEVAAAYIGAHEAGWRNAKHRQQWRNTLDQYAMPVMGALPVRQITTAEVTRVLEPIWREKPETATRLRGRIEAVLDYAAARSWRTGENPARWRGHLANLLPARGKIARVEHHAALPWREIGSFMTALASQEGAAALALRFAVLTAARTGEVLGMRWGEVDVLNAVWTVPAARMKAGREHRVPLSAPALDVLRAVTKLGTASDAFVFPGARRGKPLSSMAMLMLLRRMGRGDLTAHGFRSTFRDWCAETTAYPREVAEAALAHTLRDKVEAAYQRGDLMEKRRRLMAEWAAFCAQPATTGEVVPIRAVR